MRQKLSKKQKAFQGQIFVKIIIRHICRNRTQKS